ncbi:MAG: hypothetical protein GW760_04855 [Legionella sp.]|jgi:hypothetical protein|nr:hypothetical protein [Legionella sp.]
MLKQSLIYLLLSMLVIMLANYVKIFIIYVDIFYTYINARLNPLFGSGFVGEIFRNTFTLVLVPLAIAAIPALVYKLIKRKHMPYFIELTWVLWLIIAMSSYLIH